MLTEDDEAGLSGDDEETIGLLSHDLRAGFDSSTTLKEDFKLINDVTLPEKVAEPQDSKLWGLTAHGVVETLLLSRGNSFES